MHSVTDRRTDGQTDGRQDCANSRSYCVAIVLNDRLKPVLVVQPFGVGLVIERSLVRLPDGNVSVKFFSFRLASDVLQKRLKGIFYIT